MSNPFFLVPLATFGTSFISGLTGLGGGAILMGFLGSILNPIQAIFLHACFQALSNIFRLWIHWKNVDKLLFKFFSFAVLPGSYIGAQLLGSLSVPLLRVLLGIGLLLSLLPKKKEEKSFPGYFYSILGFLAGLMGCLMGAVGPLLARFLLRPGMSHGYFVGTNLGNYIAKFVGQKIPKEVFQKMVKVLLLIIGCQLIFKGLNSYFHFL